MDNEAQFLISNRLIVLRGCLKENLIKIEDFNTEAHELRLQNVEFELKIKELE